MSERAERAVVIGGFSQGKKAVERIADAFGEYGYSDIDALTFAEAHRINEQRGMARIVKGADVLTHSAGMTTVDGTFPLSIEAHCPPTPTGPQIVGRAGLKTIALHTPGDGIRSLEDIPPIVQLDASMAAELGVHLWANLKPLPRIMRYDALARAEAAQEHGIAIRLGIAAVTSSSHLTATISTQYRYHPGYTKAIMTR